jgi:oligopeptide/dipeptide ABC transporter ATP-binding protein
MPLLEVDRLHTQFDTKAGVVQAVNGVDLSIEHGEMVGLVGESGSGKSVLARSILGLVDYPGSIPEGDIRFKGESLVEKSEEEMQEIRGGSIAMVFQDPMNSLNPVLSVGEQIAESVRLHQDVGESVTLPAEMKRKLLGSVKNAESWRTAIEMLENVEIPDASSRALDHPHEFSGGMRQRAMIAIALAGQPDLLIADEPTTALDVTTQAKILEELYSLKDEFDTSVLLITHDLGVVAESCERVNVMYAGEIVEKASVRELFENPQHPYTSALLGSTPRVDERIDDLDPIPGNVPQLIDIPYECHFAPRCPEAREQCYDVKPDHRSVGKESNHTAAWLRRGPMEQRIDGGGTYE